MINRGLCLDSKSRRSQQVNEQLDPHISISFVGSSYHVLVSEKHEKEQVEKKGHPRFSNKTLQTTNMTQLLNINLQRCNPSKSFHDLSHEPIFEMHFRADGSRICKCIHGVQGS